MAWKDYIANMKREWVGREVSFRGEKHKVVDVDYNGGLLIDLADQFKETTAVAPYHLDTVIDVSVHMSKNITHRG